MITITEHERRLILYYLQNPDNIKNSLIELPNLVNRLKTLKHTTSK